MNETEWAISFSYGGYSVLRRYPDGSVGSTAAMPTLQDALQSAEQQSGGPVILKLLTRNQTF